MKGIKMNGLIVQNTKGDNMKYQVDEVEGEKLNPIVIRLYGEDINYIAMNGKLDVYLDERTADSISFHIQSILQDRERRKNT